MIPYWSGSVFGFVVGQSTGVAIALASFGQLNAAALSLIVGVVLGVAALYWDKQRGRFR